MTSRDGEKGPVRLRDLPKVSYFLGNITMMMKLLTLLKAYSRPSAGLRFLYLYVCKFQQSKCYFQYTDEEVEAQRQKATCPRGASPKRMEPAFDLGGLGLLKILTPPASCPKAHTLRLCPV